MIDLRIDYLQFSAMVGSIKTGLEDGHGFDFKSNNKFYHSMRRYDNGIVRYDGNPNSEKSLFIIAGKACENIKVEPDMLHVFDKYEPNFSRIDLAMTTDEPILDKIIDDRENVESEMYIDGKVISDLEYTPQTIYFGDMKQRAKKGIVRCYDKALQLNLDGIRHRVEVEYRKKHAQIAVKRLKSGASIQSVMNSKWRLKTDWYESIMGEDIASGRFRDMTESEMSEIERKMLWIEKQVIPSLQFIIDYDRAEGTSNWDRLQSLLH